MIQTGDQAIDFELPNFQNKKVRLFDVVEKHGPIFLVFYKFNCPTCQFTFPHLARVAHSLGPEHFLAVAQDTPAEATDFRNKYKFNFDVVCDTKPYPVSVKYSIDFVPTSFVIEKDKKISSIAEGFDRKAIEAFANRIAAEKNVSGFQAFNPAEQVPLLRPG